MYYNRFGKCNRGQSCPFTHDPDKVAVCTRFLRGTCKQTDGTCPFSHKVSKEKMPVCSYFLKGICNNSSCPYSHVYVSRKAAVCQDFVRGYCPLGEKCKKKHTLLCPDFSKSGVCPRGAKCKLQHRQRTKRAGPSTTGGVGKRARPEEAQDSAAPAIAPSAEPEPGAAALGPEKMPSFISLRSSPGGAEGSGEPEVPGEEGAEVTEKRLQIKPRF
ncbi:ZC3H3 protein, partial [Amia calva]|nr:ZC3H3 protein [Amia calva]